MTNEDRSFRAGNALELYDVGIEGESALVDILTDLRHYCEEEKIDFARCNSIAQWNYNAEREDAHSLETCEV